MLALSIVLCQWRPIPTVNKTFGNHIILALNIVLCQWWPIPTVNETFGNHIILALDIVLCQWRPIPTVNKTFGNHIILTFRCHYFLISIVLIKRTSSLTSNRIILAPMDYK
jgi:hypothetical protein